jgi:hypothetical protein
MHEEKKQIEKKDGSSGKVFKDYLTHPPQQRAQVHLRCWQA